MTKRQKRWLFSAVVAGYIAFAVCVSGCASAKRNISRNARAANVDAQLIQNESTSTVSDLSAALDTGEVGPAASPFVDKAISRQGPIQGAASRIQKQADQILDELPRTEDKTPWWASLLGKLGTAGIVIGIIVLLLMSGALPAIRAALAWVGAWIPKPVTQRAKFDAEIVNETDPDQLQTLNRERIAAERARDRTYDKAFRKENSRRKAQQQETQQ